MMPDTSFIRQIQGLDAVSLARRLIGATLIVRGAGGIVVETEAYGRDDPASHSHRGPTLRNASMFGPAGHAYVYRSYGIHLCLNVVGRPGEAVLIRALDPQARLDLMRMRRGNTALLCNGPGRLSQALGIRPEDDGAPFDGAGLSITLSRETPDLLSGPRIGISKAQDLPWRFGLAGAARQVSRPFPAQTSGNLFQRGSRPPASACPESP
ncbi:DNA-3-methyladenine glycosylase [Paracoccus sediminis]|uniref:Putative 3-methyladenine DNA glycosylase n=2 Tax=Paracoccus sediminis TaxID=1214787 RepID=A0A238W8R9_9RHOB|nr:DNA-3-methyladenine glycosylase [Paracoccus sediminis]